MCFTNVAKMKRPMENVIYADGLYSKSELIARLGISQKTWDKLIAEGVPRVQIGKQAWVLGSDLLAWARRNAETRPSP